MSRQSHDESPRGEAKKDRNTTTIQRERDIENAVKKKQLCELKEMLEKRKQTKIFLCVQVVDKVSKKENEKVSFLENVNKKKQL